MAAESIQASAVSFERKRLSSERSKTVLVAISRPGSSQWPILGPVALAPSLTSLNRTVEPQWGHLARTVSTSRSSNSFGLSHINWKHLGQLRTCVDIGFLVHFKSQNTVSQREIL